YGRERWMEEIRSTLPVDVLDVARRVRHGYATVQERVRLPDGSVERRRAGGAGESGDGEGCEEHDEQTPPLLVSLYRSNRAGLSRSSLRLRAVASQRKSSDHDQSRGIA